MSINFHAEEVPQPLPEGPTALRNWLKAVVTQEGSTLGELTYIFCSDEYLHAINVEHLQHDTYTDVITFQYSEEQVEGDIFISTERIVDNAQTYGVPTLHELHRVMVHGLLHLLGYGDKTPETKTLMTSKEDHYLRLWQDQFQA